MAPHNDRISRWFSGQEMTSSVSAAAFRIAVGTGRHRGRKRIGSSGLARLNEISLVTKGAVSQGYAQVVQAADLGAIERDETTADQRGTYIPASSPPQRLLRTISGNPSLASPLQSTASKGRAMPSGFRDLDTMTSLCGGRHAFGWGSLSG